MLNQVVLVGRLFNDLELKEIDGYKKELDFILEVQRRLKNADGVYETNIINCKIYDNIASNTLDYCKKGDIIGLKGHLQIIDNNMLVVADKVTFLSSSKK